MPKTKHYHVKLQRHTGILKKNRKCKTGFRKDNVKITFGVSGGVLFEERNERIVKECKLLKNKNKTRLLSLQLLVERNYDLYQYDKLGAELCGRVTSEGHHHFHINETKVLHFRVISKNPGRIWIGRGL